MVTAVKPYPKDRAASMRTASSRSAEALLQRLHPFGLEAMRITLQPDLQGNALTHLAWRLARAATALLCLIALTFGAGTSALAGNSSFVAGDNNSLQKEIIADSYIDPPSTASDKTVRIGDTATYRLTLNLSEGTTGSLTIQDVLPPGVAYAGLVSISPASGSGPFIYTIISQPAAGQRDILNWDFGDVVNTPSGDGTPVDPLIIEYQITPLPNTGILIPIANLTNSATLSYLDASGIPVTDPTRLSDTDELIVLQPRMTPIIKLGNGSTNNATSPLDINVATSTVQFHLESCNDIGLAPAYRVAFRDILAAQLDENSLSTPIVTVGGTVLGAGDYTYIPPAFRGGTMVFILNTPVNPGQCVEADYSMGFHNDLAPNQLWSNEASVQSYYSLPPIAGQRYNRSASARFFMTNLVTDEPLTKNLLTPVGTATIGEQVAYEITVPGNPVSAALSNVNVTDTLHDALAFTGATVTLDGTPLAIAPIQSGQDLSWSFPVIPAGQQAVITLTARVDNNAFANAGAVITNTAAYTYDSLTAGVITDGSSAPLTIIEPALTLSKSVNNVAPPMAGDILTYTLNLVANSEASAAMAFDTVIEDNLSLGLGYIAGSARVAGVAVEPTITGDGTLTPQTLDWASGIDIPAGATISITYDVLVLNSVTAGQTLTNSATAQWTSLAGVNADERNGSGAPASNDYLAGPVTTTLNVPIPTPTLQKTANNSVANPGDRLQYTLTLSNPSAIRLSNLTLTDNLDSLNTLPMFQPGSISNIIVPPGAAASVSGNTLTVSNLDIAPNSSQTIQFEADLSTGLAGGSLVLNQAQLSGPWGTALRSDDPTAPGVADPTRTLIPANGIVYDSITRAPLAGVTLTMLRASTTTPLPASCFIDSTQQNQITQADGNYKFDLVFDPGNCPAGEDYLLAVTAAPAGYLAEPSLIDLPVTNATTTAYSVPSCPVDALPATSLCEADASATVPASTPTYYLHLTFDAAANQLYNNHIPVDPLVNEEISILKTSPLINVSRGQVVPYSIKVKNTLRTTPPVVAVIDTLPSGFKYVEGSARVDGVTVAPTINAGQLRWDNLTPGYNQTRSVELLLRVGAGVSEGPYVNKAQLVDSSTDAPVSEVATATVRVIPDPTLDCTDVIGKVFDDRDLDGRQGDGEQGLAGVQVVTARGLIATSDAHGRFHITCAAVPDEDRGSNFILKLDDRTLPTGYRLTTENPRVQRATRGKMLRFAFGATIHRLVSLDLSDGVFEPGETTLRLQWQPSLDLLLGELKKAPSVLRLTYLADIEPERLVNKRLRALQQQIDALWQEHQGGYRLDIETEVFWRRGGPP